MYLLLAVPIFLSFTVAGWAAEPDVVPRVDPNDAPALQEAVRFLEEEVKLAARPQTYIVIDLVDRAVLIKGRGAELHRFPIEQWSAVQLAEAHATFRLQKRPPVTRRKVEPAAGAEQLPISLDDMPTEFTLRFSPSLTVDVHPSASDNFWHWLKFKWREWWAWLKGWSLIFTTGHAPPSQPSIDLTVTSHHAQSLAWTVTEGMPFLLRRTSSHPF
ncbi:MAG TPA: hypothetical protein VF732_03510 [Nitrospira sp.]